MTTPDSGNTNPPPAADPPAQPAPPVAKQPVVVNPPADTSHLMNAIESLPEKLANVFKEMNPAPPAAPAPPANQPPKSPPANQPSKPPTTPENPAQQSGSRFANWFFGKNTS
jgi:hypothetical protein